MSARRDTSADDPFDPNDYLRIFGQTFAKHERAPLLVIGNRQWNRWTLGRLGCPHPVAAATLNRVIQHLNITTIAELAQHASEIATYRGCGITVYSLVIAIVRDAGHDPEKVHRADVTYTTVKQRALREEKDTTSRRKRRKGRA
jgi:hypothetical protein